MDTIVYIIGGIVSVLWSVWLFFIWTRKASFKESSPFRFLLLFLTPSYFILITFSGWAEVLFLRVDITGLFFFILITLLLFLIQLGTLPLKQHYKLIYLISLIGGQVIYIALVIFVYMLKSYPLIAFRISSTLQSLEHIDFLKVLWAGLEAGADKQYISNTVSKIFIALGTYVPLTIIRMWYTNKRFKTLKEEIDEIKTKLALMEKAQGEEGGPGEE